MPLARLSGIQCYDMGHNGHGINLYGVVMTHMGHLHAGGQSNLGHLSLLHRYYYKHEWRASRKGEHFAIHLMGKWFEYVDGDLKYDEILAYFSPCRWLKLVDDFGE